MLDEMAKLYPDLKPLIAWWYSRCSHIFAPFRIEGLPKVNFSETGNAGWKPKGGGTLRLASTAKKDVSTMMLQEKELEKFNNQEGRSTGRGPTKAVRDDRDRKQQIKMAEQFVNILHDEEAIRLEAEEATNSGAFIPGKKSRHKPSKRLKYGVAENKKTKK